MTDFRKRHLQIPTNSEEFRLALLNDEYFNALTVKYGYAITCHKAQGGEWDRVTVHFEWSGQNLGFFRWAYTAITRSKMHLSVINAPTFGDELTDTDDLINRIADRLCDLEFRSRLEVLLNGSVAETAFIETTKLFLPVRPGDRWTKEEEDELIIKFDSKMTIAQLAKRHGRTNAAITSRLVLLGKIQSTS